MNYKNSTNGDKLTFYSETPDVNELSTELTRCLYTTADLERLTNSDDIRFCRWSGQSDDGKKHSENLPNNRQAFPFEGASDVRNRLVDSTINELSCLLTTSFERSQLAITATDFNDMAAASGANTLMNWITTQKLRADIATLRGQVEVLSNELNNAQRRQKDFYNDLDQRLRKLEPQRLSIDGREVEVDKAEQAAFDKGLAEFKAGNHQAANQSFAAFLQRYPESGYLPQAYFWLGSAHFAQQECSKAIPAYQTVTTRFPNSQKAPEALLNIASCQLDLKDKGGARETLEQLLKKYPSSSAASMGKERLAELK